MLCFARAAVRSVHPQWYNPTTTNKTRRRIGDTSCTRDQESEGHQAMTCSSSLSLQEIRLDITPSSSILIIKSESFPQHAELLLLSILRAAMSGLFPVHSIIIVGKSYVTAGDDGSVGSALATSNVRPHLAREEDGLLVSAYAVARAGAEFTQAPWGREWPVQVAFVGEGLGVIVSKIIAILCCGGSAALEFAGPRAGGCEVGWERRWWRGHWWLP
jgi:hypothetical protein